MLAKGEKHECNGCKIIRTALLFGVMIGLFMVIGWLVGTYFIGNWLLGLIIFIGLAAAINAVSYFFSSKIVLWSYRGKNRDGKRVSAPVPHCEDHRGPLWSADAEDRDNPDYYAERVRDRTQPQ